MQKADLIFSLGLFCLIACLQAQDMDQDLTQQITTSRNAAKQLGNELKLRLKTAIQSGGPSKAISVCNVEAPKIATSLSKRAGFEVGRTSLKLRNLANAPDDWETKQLHYLQQQHEAGNNNLEVYEVVDNDEGKEFRYMKAIPTGEVCLMCHGEAIAEPLQQKIISLYPNDQATGYKKGELRGAFTVKTRM
jgi:hypothetical protein